MRLHDIKTKSIYVSKNKNLIIQNFIPFAVCITLSSTCSRPPRFTKGEGPVGTQMSAHFLFELGFPPKSQASYFTGLVRCVRKKKTTHANLPCRMAVHSSEFRSQTCPDLVNTQIACHMIGFQVST